MSPLFLLIGASSFFSMALGELPSYIPVCKKNDPKLNECIIKSVETLRPKLVEGIPELEVPSLEPLHIPQIIVSQTPAFKAIGKNVLVAGASNFKILKLKSDEENLNFVFKITIPFLSFTGSYDADVKILSINLKGEGPIRGNITQVSGDVILKGHRMKSKGVEYVKFDSLDLKLHWVDYEVKLENLFQGDAILNEAVNVLINDNKKDFIRIVVPFAERVASEVLLDIANKIVSHFSYTEIFPE